MGEGHNPADAQAARFRRWLASQIATLSWAMELEHLPVADLAAKLGVTEEIVRHAAQVRARSRRKSLSGDGLCLVRVHLGPKVMKVLRMAAEVRRTTISLLLSSILHYGCKRNVHPKLEHHAVELPRIGLVRIVQEGQTDKAAARVTRALQATLKVRASRANVSAEDYIRSLMGDYFMQRLVFDTPIWSSVDLHGDIRKYELMEPPALHATDHEKLAGITVRRRDHE